jgi:hypothetical protein
VNPAISGADADPDGDGVPNLLEYAFNSAPRQAKSAHKPVLERTADGLAIIYTKISGAADIAYFVEQSTALMTWAPAGGASELLADDGRLQTVKVTLPADSSATKFLRVRVALQ